MAELSNCFFSPLKAISSNLKAHKQKKKCFYWCVLYSGNVHPIIELSGLEKLLHDCACLCVLSTVQVITNLVKMVKARDIRRPFCPAGHWLSEEGNIRADKVLGTSMM